MLNTDPFGIEAQRRIEEEIRLLNVTKNMETAMGQIPESFCKVRFSNISEFICIIKLHS